MAKELHQPVDGFLSQLGSGVLLFVPRLVNLRIRKTKIRTDIDQDHSAVEQLLGQLHGDAVGSRCKDHVAPAGHRLGIHRLKDEVVNALKRRQHLRYLLPHFGRRRDILDSGLGVRRQKAQQLAARIP